MSTKPPAGGPGDLETVDLGPKAASSDATLDTGAAPVAGGSREPRRLGRFELLELLGRGAMGSVYKALDPRLGRSVALKLLRAGAGSVDRFLHEARAQARVDHPNVCKVFEADLIGGEPYIAMQLVPGETLGSAAASMGVEEKVAVLRGERDRARRTALLDEAKGLLKSSLERAPLLAGERASLRRALGLP